MEKPQQTQLWWVDTLYDVGMREAAGGGAWK